jgi:alkanesulfonate monooxygenase SsuD/methylene tetrahydromethanopterin reductase-like flavin-dependent oxidoreductase (luciferase family)
MQPISPGRVVAGMPHEQPPDRRRPFRFGVLGERIRSCEGLLAEARRAEALGYSTLLLRDHFVPEPFGDQLAPMVALAAAAGTTRTLRVGTLVLDNDWRHPVLLAKEAATLDLLSGGRLELGSGRDGCARSTGELPFDAPGVRVGRLEESLRVLKGLLAGPAFMFAGAHYSVTGLEASRGRCSGPALRSWWAPAASRCSGSQLQGQVGHKHQLVGWPVTSSYSRVPPGLGDAGVQQRGRRHHQHTAGALVAGWVQEQAEVAVQHVAGFQGLAVGVSTELPHRPGSLCWRFRHQGYRVAALRW